MTLYYLNPGVTRDLGQALPKSEEEGWCFALSHFWEHESLQRFLYCGFFFRAQVKLNFVSTINMSIFHACPGK